MHLCIVYMIFSAVIYLCLLLINIIVEVSAFAQNTCTELMCPQVQ